MPLPEMRMGMAKAVSIAESLEIQKTASNRMKEALAKQAADRLSKSETTTDGTGYSNISQLVVDTHDSIDWDTLLSFSGLFIPLLQDIEKVHSQPLRPYLSLELSKFCDEISSSI